MISTTSPVPDREIARAQRDLEFVTRQILRFLRMERKEVSAHLRKHPRDAFCVIPHPDGRGHYHCGSQAWEKLGSLADRILALDPSLEGRISQSRAKEILIAAFASRVLKEHQEISREITAALLDEVLETCRQLRTVMEHHFPCVLFLRGGPEEFRVGPVTFTRRPYFFKVKQAALKQSVAAHTEKHIELVNEAVSKGFSRDGLATPSDSERLARRLQARAIRTYRGYPWIASVTVTDCGDDVSQNQAIKAVQIALHAVRVVLGAHYTRKLRVAWSGGDALKSAHMWTDADQIVHVSVASSAIGPVGPENWHEGLMLHQPELEVFGSTLVNLLEPTSPPHLNVRLLDAISWFGDAATDSTPSASIIKYVSAIERLLFGAFERERRKTFAVRVAALCKTFFGELEFDPYQKSLDLYEQRSELLHGATSPRFLQQKHAVYYAEELCRMCLLASAQLYPMMLSASRNPDPNKLEETMTRIASEGVSWLAETAGYVRRAE